MESPGMEPALRDLEQIIDALDPNASAQLDLARLCVVMENLQIHGFQRRDLGRLEELLKRLQSFPRPEALVNEEFFGALAKLYDNLVTGDFTRREVLSLNLQLLFAIEDLSDHPQGKVLCGKHFITRLIALACAKSGSLKLKRVSVETLCALVTRSAENQSFFILHVAGCYKFFKLFLPKCGDFQLQASAAEILFRLTRRHKRLLDVVDVAAAKTAMLSMHDAKKPNLRADIRNFVNLLNESMGASRSVHSFRALQVFINGAEDVTHEEVWVHIGLDHVSYYTHSSSKEVAGIADIIDFEFKNIKEIKVVQNSFMELIVWRPQDNDAVPARTVARFSFPSEVTTSVYECCMARLSSLKATVALSSSQTPWTGKTSIGILVPLPKSNDFPVLPDHDANENAKESLPTPLFEDEPAEVVPSLKVNALPEAQKNEGSRSPSVMEVAPRPHSVAEPVLLEEEENVMQLRSKLKAMLEGSTKSATRKLKENSFSSPKSNPPGPVTTPFADQTGDKLTVQRSDKRPTVNEALKVKKQQARAPAKKVGPGRPRKNAAPKPRKVQREESPARGDEMRLEPSVQPLKVSKRSAESTKKSELKTKRGVNSENQEAISVQTEAQQNPYMTPVTKAVNESCGNEDSDGKKQLVSERFSFRAKEEPTNDVTAPPLGFERLSFSAATAEVEIKKPRSRRRRYTLAELTNAPELLDLRGEEIHTKRQRFENDDAGTKRTVNSPAPTCLQTEDYSGDGAMNDVVMLFATMMSKFKMKLQSRIRDKTVLILSSTSEAIKLDASDVELQMQKETEEYLQHYGDKLEQIEMDLHEKSKGFKQICEEFDKSFKRQCEQLEQLQAQVECTEDELGALSEKRKLAHRKLIAQMQKRSEQRLSEAESKILAVRKSAKHMEGFKEILQLLVMDSV